MCFMFVVYDVGTCADVCSGICVIGFFFSVGVACCVVMLCSGCV